MLETNANLAHTQLQDPIAGVDITDNPEGLSAIHKPGCSASIWQRAPLPRFQSWLDALPKERLPKVRTILQPGAVRRAMFELVQSAGVPASEERAMLVDDISAMADIFADLMQAPYLRLRLDVIETNACRKFHIDAVTARLVCTYRGTGTQYGTTGDGQDPIDIQTVATASPIVLRGTLWPVTPQSGLVHRSPPIEGTGETRLVLVLDPITELADESLHHAFH